MVEKAGVKGKGSHGWMQQFLPGMARARRSKEETAGTADYADERKWKKRPRRSRTATQRTRRTAESAENSKDVGKKKRHGKQKKPKGEMRTKTARRE